MEENFKFYGVDTVKLSEKYGTPLYVMSEDHIVERCLEINEDFVDKYENAFAVYAGKAFSTKEMCRIVKREGLGLDVVSGGEIYTALSVDFPVEKIVFHGNNKSNEELNYAIDNNIGRINVDNIPELREIHEIAQSKKKVIKVLFRLTPGVDSHTHHYISTGQKDSKFGISLKEEILYEAVEFAMSSDWITLAGFHFHVGSQLSDNKSHLLASKVLIDTMKALKNDFGYETQELNIGGGFGIYYSEGDVRQSISYFVDPIMTFIEEECKKQSLIRPLIIIEPGRWVVGEAGITLYTIGSIKKLPGIRTYVGIDGGMPDNPRPSLYQAKYEGLIANKANQEPNEIVTIAGKCCESGDILVWDMPVVTPKSGDILAIKSTGAYNYSMANNYNKLLIPPVIMIKDGVDRVVVKRQTYEDLLSREL